MTTGHIILLHDRTCQGATDFTAEIEEMWNLHSGNYCALEIRDNIGLRVATQYCLLGCQALEAFELKWTLKAIA
jgi:hypothetical protein